MKFRKIAYALFLSILSFISYSQISVNTNFNIIAGRAIDTRLIAADIAARDAIVWKYEGLTVYVISTQTNYQLVGGNTNANWQSVTSGSFYDAGTGITMTANSFSHTPHTGDATGATSLTVVAIQGRTLASTIPSSGDVLGWNGSAWAPVTALSNYTTGTGIVISGNTISALNTSAIWNANLIMGSAISTVAPTNNQVLEWNGTTWAPATDDNTIYSAGTGLSLTGSVFANTGDLSAINELQDLSYNASTRALGITTGTGITLPIFTTTSTDAGLVPGSNNGGATVFLNGAGAWTAPIGTTYAAGTGITLTSTVFSHTAHTGDATGTTSLTVVALQGRSVTSTIPTTGNYLGWNGSNWIPSTPIGTTYSAGTGLSLTGSVFANTGDLSATNELQDLSYNASTRALGISTGSGTTLPMFSIASTDAGLVAGSNGAGINVFLNGNGTWSAPPGTNYEAGLGITLTSNSFSHTAHTGDATGTTSLTVVALQGRSVLTTIPTTGNYLGWNGSNWVPSTPIGTTYSAGTGLSLTGSVFANTGDLSAVNELQNLSYNISTRALGITTGAGVSLPLFATATTDAGLVAGSNGAGINVFLNGNGTWSAPPGTNYEAGTGITLTSNSFSHAVHTGDATGITSLTVVALQGRSVTSTIPTTGNYLGWNGSNWIPSTPIGTTYSAGTGLSLTGSVFANTGDLSAVNELQDLSYNASTRALGITTGSGISLPLFSTATTDAGLVAGSNGAGINVFLNGNGTWSAPPGTNYEAGLGITLTSNSFSHTAHTGDATGTTSLSVVALQGRSVLSTIPTTGNYLGWNGSNWVPSTPIGTTYSAGTGLSLTGSVFANTGDLNAANELQDLSYNISTRALGITTGAGVTLPLFGSASTDAGLVPGSNSGGATVFLNGTGAWTAPVGTNYSAGTGITLTGTVFSHTAHTGDATGTTSLTVVALQGRSVLTTIPTTGNYLGWNGTDWIPSTPAGTNYSAGTGLSLTGSVFANTGDLSATNELQDLTFTANTSTLNISSGTGVALPLFVTTSTVAGLVPGSNNGGVTSFLNGNGAWTVPVGTTYSAGTGITLTGSVFSNSGDLSSINELQNLSYTISTRALGISTGSGITLPLFATASTDAGLVAGSNGAGVNVFLNGNGTWSAPTGTIYSAGTGLSLTGSVFANTGDLSAANELQDLTFTANTSTLNISSGTGVALPLFVTTSTVAGLVPGSNNGGATSFLNGNGAWTIPAGTTYSAGTGITLTGSVFSHTTHTGDATGITSLTVVAIQGRTVLSIAPSSNEILKWNGAAWAPATDNNTSYSAGTGLSLTGSVFANTGDLSVTNEIQDLSYNISTRALGITSGTGVTLPLFAPASTDAGLVSGSNGAGPNVFLNGNGTWSAPTGTTYSAGTGLSLTGSVFANTGDLSAANELQDLTFTANTSTLNISSGTGVALPLFVTTSTVAGLVPGSNNGGTTSFLNGSGAWTVPAGTTYSAGTGITLTGTVFSHTAHTGDATGITSLTVVALQGRSVLSTIPTAGNYLGWNGTDWIPSTPTSNAYSAGTGLSLTGSVFANTGDLSAVNELQDLTYNTSTRALGISTGSGTTLPLFSTVTTDAGLVSGSNGAGVNVFLNGNGTWTAPPGTNYEAGIGITLTSNSFSHTAHTGDATGITSLTVVAIQGRSVLSVAPSSNEILKWNGAAWAPASDDNNIYSAGTGLSLTGSVFANTGDLSATNELQDLSYNASTRALGISTGSGTTLPLFSTANTDAGLVSGSNGAGINVFLNGSGTWTAPPGTNYEAGIGITLTSNSFSHTAHTGDATGSTSLTVIAIQGRSVLSVAPSSNEILKWNGAAWAPATDNNTSYSAGTGITLTSTVFSHTAHTGDATGTTSLTVVALQGRAVLTTIPTAGNYLGWNGSDWIPSTPVGSNYSAGTGLSLTGTVFANTGDLSSVNELQNLTYTANTSTLNISSGTGVALPLFVTTSTVAGLVPGSNNGGATSFLNGNGAWTIPAGTTYSAGTGITLTSTVFSHTAHTGDATGTTSLTVVALQGRAVLTTIPTAGNYLGWNGTDWIPSTPTSNAYSAGTGLSLTGSVFANTGDLSSVNELQNLSYTPNTSTLNISSGTGVALPLFVTTSTVAGLVPGSNNGGATSFLNGNGAWTIPAGTTYAAGTGITLTGSVFSHTAHTGDATGTTSLTVVALQGRSVLTTIPTAGNYLGWNGTDWIPSTPTSNAYSAGTGLSLTGSVFANTGDLSSVNELQNLSYTPNTSTLNISSGTGVALPLFVTTSTVAGLVPGSNNGGATSFLNGNGAWTIPAGTTYSAGTGITLTSTVFSHTAHTGDATGTTSLTVVALQGRSVLTTIPTAGNYLGWNGTDWIPSTPTSNAYSAGTGLSLTGSVFANTGDLSSVNELQNLTYTANTSTLNISSGTGIALPLFVTTSTIAGLVPGSNNGGATSFLNGNGAWTIPAGTTYSAGTGITLTGTVFSHTAHTGDATGTTSLTVVALQGRAVLSTIPTAGNYLGWNGTDWIPSTPTSNAYSAGTGLSLTGSVFANTGDLSSVNELQNLSYTPNTSTLNISSGTGVALPLFVTTSTVAGLVPGSNNGGATSFLNGNGAWTIPAGTTYSAGTGITLTSTVFSHTAHTGDATGTTSLTVVALQGRAVLTTIPTAGNYLGWNGSDWIPSTPTGTTYSAGTGLSLTGSVFANTGDLSSVNELQDLSYIAATRVLGISTGTGVTLPLFTPTEPGLVPAAATGSALIFLNGAGAWTAPVGTTYSAGTGITLTGTVFSHTAHTGDATGTTSLTVVALQGRSVLTTIPTTGNYLGWNGSNWIPSTPIGTTYSAGTGLSLTGTVFANTGDLSSVNELQNLSYTPNTSTLNISSGTGVALPLFVTTSTVAGLVPGSNNAGATAFLNANGAWSIPIGTAYSAGTGITLTGTVFSHTAHTGDATGITSLTVVALQGRSLLSTAPNSNEILKWNGAAWAPGIDDNNLYSAGTGIYLSGSVFSNTGDLSSVNELQDLSYNNITRALGITTGSGVTLPLFSTTTTEAGLVTGSNGADTTKFLDATGRWALPPGHEYSAGTGLALTGSVFINIADPSSTNEIQSLSYNVATRGLGLDLGGGGTTLPYFSALSTDAGLVPGSNNGGINVFLNGNGGWTIPAAPAYAAGDGITILVTTFSHTPHTGDATGATSITVVGLQGRQVVATAPSTSDVLKWNGSAWAPASDATNPYAAGIGLSLGGNTFNNTGDLSTVNEIQSLSYTAGTRTINIDLGGTGTLLPYFHTITTDAGLVPGSNSAGPSVYLNGSGFWTSPPGTSYGAGDGITLTGTIFSHTSHTGDATGSTSLTVTGLQGRPVAGNAPAMFDVLKWDGFDWRPEPDASNSYAAGTGLSLAGSTFNNTGDLSTTNEIQSLNYNIGTRTIGIDLGGGGALLPYFSTLTTEAGLVYGANGAGANLFLNGIGTWTAPAGTAYGAGTGLTLTGTVFSHTAHSGDATGSTTLTVTGLQGRPVTATIPTDGQILKYTGGTWLPADNNSYAAGTGLSLAGSTFSNTGDLSTTNEIQNLSYTAGTRTIGINLGGTGTILPYFSNINTEAGLVPGSNGAGATLFLNGSGTWTAPAGTAYGAGTGLTLTGTVFSHTAHSGDATGSTTLTVTGLQGRPVTATIPTDGQILKYTGGTWLPADNTTYAAGTGLSLAGSTFSNTGDLSTTNEIQNLSYTAGTRTIGINLGGTGTILPYFSNINTEAGLVPGSNGAGATLFLNGSGTWTAPAGTAYGAGTGLTLTGTVFSHTAHSGDVTGSTTLTVTGLQGRPVTATIPTDGQILKYTGGTWLPSDNTTYAAGTGLSLAGSTFSNTGDLSTTNEIQNLSYTAGTRTIGINLGGTGTILPYFSNINTEAGLVPGSNGAGATLFLNGAGTWSAPAGTAYAAGTGLTLSGGSVFSHTAHSGDATGSTTLTVTGLQGRPVTATIPTEGQILKYSGGTWLPADNTTYAAGAGLSLAGSTFSNTGDLSTTNEIQSLNYNIGTRTMGVDLGGGGALLPYFSTLTTEAGLVYGANGAGANLFLNGSGTWTAPAGTAYSAGTGLSLASTVFSHAAHTGDATGITSLTVVALQGRPVAAGAPGANEILKWNGSAWTPAADASATYVAGAGLTLASGTFSITAPVPVSLGGTGFINATNGQLLIGNASATFTKATITAGTGISVTNGDGSITIDNTSPNANHTGDATGATALTVVALQGRTLNATAPIAHDVIKWDGTAWGPDVDNNTTYSAGTGLSLTGTVFDNTGDLSSTNEIQSLSYTPGTRSIGISNGGTGTTLPLFATASGDAGLTPGSSGGGATVFLNGNGSWSAPVGTTYAAGLGITLSSNTFAHTAHTGDATGTTSLTVVAIRGVGVSATAPSAGQILKFTGGNWIPASDDNTTYVAGAGLTLSSGTFSITTPIPVNLGGTSFINYADGQLLIGKTDGTLAKNRITAGTGITVTNGDGTITIDNSNPNATHTGDATGSSSLTVVALQGRSIATTVPTSGNMLGWNGSAWLPTNAGVMPAATSGQTLRHDGSNWLVTSFIYNSGTQVGIGTTAPSSGITFEVNGRIKTATIYESSDIRYKENITPISNALDKTLALQGVFYNWKPDYAKKNNLTTDEKMIGLIAQDVEKVMPEIVMTDQNGYKSIRYSNVVGLLIEAIKDQNKEIEQLKASQLDHNKQIDQLKAVQIEQNKKIDELYKLIQKK